MTATFLRRSVGVSLIALLANAPAFAQTPLPPITVTTPKAQGATLEREPAAKPAQPAAQAEPVAPAPAPKKKSAGATPPAVIAPVTTTAPNDLEQSQARAPAIATSDTGTSVSVVTARDIEAQQIRTVPEALRSLPGVSVSRVGNAGGVTQVRLRGAEGNHTLVLIDGIQANTPAEGEFDFSNLPAEDIERIEVIRGPMSGLYGTGAVGGVINITTKKARGPATLTLRSEIGSFGTQDLAVRAQGGNETGYLAASGHFRKSAGYNITEAANSTSGENDRLRIGSFALNGGIKIAPTASLDMTLRNINKFADRDAFDSSSGVALDDASTLKSSVWLAGIGLKVDSLEGKLTHELRLDHNATRLNDFDRHPVFGEYKSINDSRRTTAGYAATYRLDTPAIWAKHAVTGLVQKEAEVFTPLSDFEDGVERSRNRVSFAGEWRGTFADQFDVVAGARRDNNDVFADFTTWRTSAAWRIPGTGIRPHASYGTAVKLPSMYEQFGAFPAIFIANPNLQPETSRGFDAGVEFTWLSGKAVLDVTYFRSVLKNEIDVVGFPQQPINQDGKSHRQGIEVASRLQITPAIALGMAYTYTDAREPDGQREDRRAPHSGRVDLSTRFAEGKGTFNIAAAYNGRMPDNTICFGLTCPPARVELNSALVVSVAAAYKLQSNLEVFARVENALDRQYQEIYGYNTPGIAAYVGMKVTFGPGAK